MCNISILSTVKPNLSSKHCHVQPKKFIKKKHSKILQKKDENIGWNAIVEEIGDSKEIWQLFESWSGQRPWVRTPTQNPDRVPNDRKTRKSRNFWSSDVAGQIRASPGTNMKNSVFPKKFKISVRSGLGFNISILVRKRNFHWMVTNSYVTQISQNKTKKNHIFRSGRHLETYKWILVTFPSQLSIAIDAP